MTVNPTNRLTTLDFFKSISEKVAFYDLRDPRISGFYNPIDINKCLAFEKDLVELADQVNSFNISKFAHYTFLYDRVPQKRRFVPFQHILKRDKKLVDEYRFLCDYYEFGSNDLAASLEILTKKDIETISDLFKQGGVYE